MVDSVNSLSGSGFINQDGSVNQDILDGNFDNVLGPNTTVGPDALALLKAQQQISLDMQKFQMASAIVSDKKQLMEGMLQKL